MARKGEKRKNENGFEEWGGYMAAKLSKLENQYLQEHQETVQERISNIFSSVAIFVNGYTTPTAEELKRIMLAHGGTYHHYYNSKTTTHIIASNLCNAKIKKLRGDEKFVKPEWIVDSLEAKYLLDFKKYLLYPESSNHGQKKIDFAPVSKKHDVVDLDDDSYSNFGAHVEPQNQELTFELSPTKNAAEDSKHPREIMKRAGEDDFLTEFYNRSRLHHISTMGAFFKRQVSELRENSDGTFPGIIALEKWKETMGYKGDCRSREQTFMHIDMDCFFVSVGLRNHPELRGKPIVVTHAKADSKPLARREGSSREFEFDCYKNHWIKNSKFANDDESAASVAGVFPRLKDLDETCSMSEIASCSYEARAAGIYNGMFMGGALKLCPNLIAIPYDFEGYKEVSSILYNTVASYTLDIEAVSCDELYADITSILRQTGLNPAEFATHLRQVIVAKTNCNASVGMGPNMLLARLSTKKAKPNGIFHISKDAMSEFMKGHKVSDLPGVGRSITHRLNSMNVHTCADMQQITIGKLQQEFGQKQGQTLYQMCRGEDKRSLKTENVRKSISADVNYGIRFANEQEMYKFTLDLSNEVSKRMEEIHVRGTLLTLKLKIRAKDAPVETAKFMGHGVCDSISRSTSLQMPTRDSKTIHREVLSLLRQLKVDCCELRGVGIQLSKLVPDNAKGKQGVQNSLLNFVARSRGEPQPEQLTKTTENIPIATAAEQDIHRGEIQQKITSNVESTFPTTDVASREDTDEDFSLPSASQVDLAVLDELPEDIKKDLIREYQRKGVRLGTVSSAQSNDENFEPVAGPSNAAETPFRSAPQPPPEKALSYEGINQVSDIDASIWSALPDDIKSEIERDIQKRKAEANSPTKAWGAIFNARRSPNKVANKPTKRKGKERFKPKNPFISKATTTNVGSKRENIVVVNKVQPTEIKETKPVEEELSLSGATTLPEIRQLLIEWFSSTETPEEEDSQAVSTYLAGLVNKKELDKVEPILRLLKRWSVAKNDSWKRVVDEIINTAQLYVIQYYNAPLKLPSSA